MAVTVTPARGRIIIPLFTAIDVITILYSACLNANTPPEGMPAGFSKPAQDIPHLF